MAEGQEKDLVVTYITGSTGSGHRERLDQALAAGYRVVDVMVVPITPGGATSGYGFSCITVVLTKEAASCPYLAVHRHKQP